MVGKKIRDFLPQEHLLSYVTAILRVYNLHGRRDNKYKARIKILVHETGTEELASWVEAEWQALQDSELKLPDGDVAAIKAYFAPPELPARPEGAACAAGFARLLRMARPERHHPSQPRLCGRHHLAQGHRRGTGRRDRCPDGGGGRPC
jgi:sulfite reductase beta subunit-like hemoprotein